MSEQRRYSMLIQWSDEDEAHLVTLPEWEGRGLLARRGGVLLARAHRRER